MKKLEAALEMAQVVALSHDARISKLQMCLLRVEDRLLKIKEGHALAVSNLAKLREAKGTTLDSQGRESARVASLEVALERLRSKHATTLAITESSLN